MRRNLILLAVLLAGIGGAGTPEPTAPAAGVQGIAAVDGLLPTAFVRPAPVLLSAAWQEGSGAAPRPVTTRLDLLASGWLDASASSLQARFEARSATYRGYAVPFALARAGRSSFNTTTPPPFRIV